MSDSEIPWIVAHSPPLSVEFFREGYCGRLPFPPPWHLPDSGINSMSLASSTLVGGFFLPLAPPGKPLLKISARLYQLKFRENGKFFNLVLWHLGICLNGS